MSLLVRMTSDFWTGERLLPGGELLTLDHDLALQVEKAGHGQILNREAIQMEPEPEPEPEEPSMDAGVTNAGVTDGD